MAASRWFAGWLLFLALLKIFIYAGDQNMTCMALEFGGVRPTDKQIEIQKDSYINLTVFFHKASNCQKNDQEFVHIKISKAKKDMADALCKFVLKKECQMSDLTKSTSCRCLGPHTVQFLKKASISDSGTYFWTWFHEKGQKKQQKEEGLFISVKETANTSDDKAKSTTTTITVTAVSVGVVVMVLAGLFFWMRCKPNTDAQTSGQDHCPTELDDADNDHVNEQGMNQVEDTYYTEITESENSPTLKSIRKQTIIKMNQS